jgi:MscS family membrane protein
MLKLLAPILLAATLRAQTPAPAPAQTTPPDLTDRLGRTTPQDAVVQFLEACHAHDYTKAIKFLDLRQMSAAQRAKDGPPLARQLEDLLDDTPFELSTLSRDPEGDRSDGLPRTSERLDTFHVNGQSIDLELERVELRPGLRVWLVSAASVELIPKAHQAVAETPFEAKLPQKLVTVELFETPIWRWIALALIGAALWFAAGFVARTAIAVVRPLVAAPRLRGPIRLCLTVVGLRVAMEFASPAVLARTFMERGLALIFALAVAWAAVAVVDFVADRWRNTLDPRMQAVSYSVLPLGKQVINLSLFLVAILAVISGWGFNISAILAGLGVGGLAVALAAQKTIENLFGGISVIGDRPVLVGDVCRFGDRTGTIMHIGLRSTRIRTADRTIISVPNAQFSSMELENISGRDKIFFHPTLNLRRDTTSEQLLEVLASFNKILAEHPKLEIGKVPVRFVGVGPYSLDVEVAAYVTTSDGDEFFTLQQELLLRLLQAVEKAGTALAVPLQESVGAPHSQQG